MHLPHWEIVIWEIASGSWKQIKIWDTNNGRLKSTLYFSDGRVRKFLLLDNGYLASGDTNQKVRIWDLTDE